MAISITPAVDKWAQQVDAFTIIIKGYDDNGEVCKNEHLSIQYNITYDGSTPDLVEMTRVYSDASGIIVLTITEPCVISLYGIHSRDVNDTTKGEIVQEIAINYKITFKPIILDLTVEYTGPDIFISDSFNSHNLLIKARMSDDTIEIIDPTNCVIKNHDYAITQIGNNAKTLLYEDTFLNTIWFADFIVVGVPKLLSIEGYFKGEKHIVGDRIYPDEVIVHGTFLTAIDKEELIELTFDEWYFVDLPIITEVNNGILRIQYKNQITQISIPYDNNISSLRLNVWYEGAKIEVGKSYDPNNVIIYIVYPDNNRKRINYRLCQISSYLVEKEGWNWYTITYVLEDEIIKQEFPVPGVIYKDYIDLDFKVLYIDKITKEENDITEEFKNDLYFENELSFSWTVFLSTVNRLQKYGLYIITVPKLCGLSNQYDMDWEVLCINETTLKANILKIYNEEETKNGKN